MGVVTPNSRGVVPFCPTSVRVPPSNQDADSENIDKDTESDMTN